ncbi:MAG: protein phosphatase 2C domain-containing protein [archaeon]|nr:protein phosphatase 2C domain-containing protein [archaeon]
MNMKGIPKPQNKEKKKVDKILEKYMAKIQRRVNPLNRIQSEKKLRKKKDNNISNTPAPRLSPINRSPNKSPNRSPNKSPNRNPLPKNMPTGKYNFKNLLDENEFSYNPHRNKVNMEYVNNQMKSPENKNNKPRTPEKLKSKGLDFFNRNSVNPPKIKQNPKINPLRNKKPPDPKKYKSPERNVNKDRMMKNLVPFLKKNKILIFKKDFENTKKILKPQKRPATSIYHPYKNYFYMEDMNKNTQKEMQDFHSISETINGDENASFFSIFDGHGGQFSGKYCEKNFIKVLSKEYLGNKNNVTSCIEKSFNKVNEDLLQIIEPQNDGTTASIVLIQRLKIKSGNIRYIYCGNVGDSRIYLLQKSGNCLLLSKDHNCKDQSEVHRIKEKGGLVFNGRVFGCLALTRSIGDKEMKEYGVCCEPYISKHLVSDVDNYIVIASDGIWDVLSEKDMALLAKEEDLGSQDLCMKIINFALKGGTTDNVSCIVIKL